MQTDVSPPAGTSRRLIYAGVAAVLVLLMLSFRGDAQSHGHSGLHAAGLQRGHQAVTPDAYGCVKARIKKQLRRLAQL
ncbi:MULTISPECIES: hypothetical protein [Serratia]|uniref:hypothetical protein n=1 Tax=Serratia TaxID=613 RepID=UPI0018D41C59|nr:hypothetical protein [Serratia marcescens]MBH1917396.1 hypothetical protein [Serratia marcescens]MBH2678739.1 hypothetical protein [Serratia marcescens]MBN3976846.1 hypothetical protein [Serratia marcescens]HEO9035895.1 hypothetical protein [Serratia marcescens]